ncbi:MAG: hypothetical protein JO103_02760 [Candidatus Eremiobacteraeota bacterium]|nr:hypothetical protein [Candidatus Eremiobacteraeota bacterium]MBV9408366.1 hypothetical protein [Candidatus Eremiobacteraeota bacterium]
MAGFIIRLIGYALLLGLTSRIAQTLWTNYGLDAVGRLHHFHDVGLMGLLIAPVILALVGVVVPLRSLAVFVGFYLAGAALTAPFVCAKVAQAGM